MPRINKLIDLMHSPEIKKAKSELMVRKKLFYDLINTETILCL